MLGFLFRFRVKRARRVRLHMIEPNPNVDLPSIEGLLVSKRSREYAIAVPVLITGVAAAPTELDSKLLIIPREHVAFYEVIR